MLVIAIGKGATGTRILSQALSAAGVDMGPRNPSGDLVPAEAMYAAVRIAGRYVDRVGVRQWDFGRLLATAPTPEFQALVRKYAARVLDSTATRRGWKLPETLLALPWIVQMFPDAAYVYWSRAPQASIGKPHLTDRLRDFGAPGGTWTRSQTDMVQARIESWAYQWQIVQATRATGRPSRWLHLRWEEVINDQAREWARLGEFIGCTVPPVAIDRARLNRDIRLRTAYEARIPDDVAASFRARANECTVPAGSAP